MVVATRLPDPRNDGAKRIVVQAEKFLPAIPRHVDKEQFLHALVTAANELEKECTSVSVMISALNACKIGLMPGKALGLAYFVPYWNRHALGRDKGANECQMIPGYRGYIDLSHRNKFLRSIHTDVVLEGEELEQWADETGARFKHKIDPDREYKPELVTHAYCIVQLNNGGRQIKVINRQQIDSVIPEKSQAWGNAIDFIEMCQKTAIRRAAKQWKLTPEMAYAVHLDEQVELGVPQAPLVPMDVPPEEPKDDPLDAYGDPEVQDHEGGDPDFPPKVGPTFVPPAVPAMFRAPEAFRTACMEAACLPDGDRPPHMSEDEFNKLFPMVRLQNKHDTPARQSEIIKAFAENRIDRASGKVTNGK